MVRYSKKKYEENQSATGYGIVQASDIEIDENVYRKWPAIKGRKKRKENKN